MPPKRKHHYIPKFHLRHFSLNEKGKQLKICRKQPFRIIHEGDLRSQGYIKNFYGKTEEYEDALGEFENEVSKVIQHLIKTKNLPQKSSIEYFYLLFHTILQNSRTNSAANRSNEIIDETAKIFTEGDLRFDKLGHKIKFEIDNPVFLSLQTLHKAILAAQDLDCKLIINNTERAFITSDNPVLKYNQFLEKRKHPGGHLGLSTKGLQIIFPIHPFYALFFYDERMYNVGFRKRKSVITENKKDIDSINLLQYLSSDKVLFSNEHISDHYMETLQFQANKKPWKKELLQMPISKKSNSDGTTSEIHHSYTKNPSIGLQLSFVKETSTAKASKPSGYYVELRKDNRK